MSKFATRLGAFLYWTVLILEGVLGLGFIALILVSVAAVANPGALADMQVRIGDRATDPAMLVASLVLLATMIAFAAFAAMNLRQLLGTLRDGDPFAAANIGRLRRIAAALVLLSVQAAIVVLTAPATIFPAGTSPWSEIDYSGLFAALIALALSEVFREGLRLREDAEGTV